METTPSMAYATQKKPSLVPVQGRQRDRRAAPQPSPPMPRRPTRALPHIQRGDTQAPSTPRAPSPPSHTAGGHSGPPAGGQVTQAGGRGDRAKPPPPPRAQLAEHGTAAGTAEGHKSHGLALPAPCAGIARGARATPARWGGVHRGCRSAHTHHGHAARTRRAHGPNLRIA